MDANWWNNALQSYDIGRQHRADRENAQAWGDGGEGAYGRVEQAAGARGDMQTAMGTRRFQDQQQQQAYEWFTQNAPRARNILRRARAIQDPQQRGAFLTQWRQHFEGIGFQPDQIDQAIAQLTNPATADEAFASYDAAFTQHTDPNWQISPYTGQAQAMTPEGQFITGGMSPDADRIEETANIELQNARRIASGVGLRSGGGGGGGGYQVLTPEEAEAMGLPAGRTYQQNLNTGQITTVGGSSGMLAGAEQRGRIALTFPNIVQAQQDLATLEQNAVRRQGTHGSNTPLGQDWLARVAEAVPFDGGSAARMVGGPDYQAYETASRTFEQSVMPIFSGSAVTESEAQRFVRANLPRMGDDAETLQRKAMNRARIINSAATILGEAPPYPDAGTWSPAGGLQMPQGAAGSPGAPAPSPENDPLGIR